MSRRVQHGRGLRRSSGAAVVVLAVLATMLTGCISARAGTRCRTTDFGQDARNVLVCRNGRWRVLMTKQRAAQVMLAASPTTTTLVPVVSTTSVPTPPPSTAPVPSGPVTVEPQGYFAVKGVPGYITIAGRLFDPDTMNSPVNVRVLVDGRWVHSFSADLRTSQADGAIGQLLPNDMDEALPMAPGSYRVCVEGFNTGLGANLLRCYDLTVGVPLAGITSASGGDPYGTVGCFVMADTTVRCRGNDEFGAVGDGPVRGLVSDPVTVVRAEGGPLTGVRSVETDLLNTCALMLDGTVRCWGENEYGTVGDGTADGSRMQRPTATVVLLADGTPLSSVTALTLAFHGCALLADSTMRCWGYNSFGGLGDGSTTLRARAVPVVLADGSTLSDITQIDAGRGSTCARQRSGHAFCWGYDITRYAGENIVHPRIVEDGYGHPLSGVEQIQVFDEGDWCARRLDTGIVCVAVHKMPVEGAIPGPPPVPAPVMDGPGPLTGAVELMGHCVRRIGLPARCWDGNTGTISNYAPLPRGAGQFVATGGSSYFGVCYLSDAGYWWCGYDDTFGPIPG